MSAAFVALSAMPLLAQQSTSQIVSGFEHTGPIADVSTKLYSPKVHAVPARVSSEKVSRIGATAISKTMQVSFNLPLRNEDQLDALLADLYNPASPSFHKYLSPIEFDKRFGPVQADYDALVSWAENNGFTIVGKTSNLRILNLSAPVALVNKVFHTTITDYNDAERGRTFYAPISEPQMDLPVPVLGIDGLENADPPTRHYRHGNAKEINRSLANITGSGPGGFYLPSDMRAAYYGNGPLTGAGQIVGIFSFDGYLPADLSLYYSGTGTTLTVPVQNVLTGGFSGNCVLDTPCDDGEQILDIAQVAGMAPGLTKILFYENGSTANTELNQMVTDNLAKVISSSWSGGGFGTSSDTYFKQMATQGQTYLNATGDSGAYNSSTYLAPGLDAYIINVGGTDLVTNGAGGTWSSETAWAGSSGGFRSTAGQAFPTWQTGIVTTANQASATYRNSPDVAAEGNYDNPTVANGLLEGGYGGTSFATPRYAGYIALANQQSVANGGTTLGFFNPTLYSLGLGANAAANYHDITSGTNPSTAGTSTTYTAVAGYDLVTGWGSPNGAGLINSLAGAAYQDFAIAGASTTGRSLTRGTSITDNITVGDFNGFTGAVTFSTGALPTGITAVFAPSSSTTGTTVTFTADNTAMISTSAITVTGTSGTLTHSITYNISVFKRANSDFTVAATTNNTVPVGNSTSDVITVTEGSGLQGPVVLSVTGLPTGVTASFDNASTTSTANLTFTAASSAIPGTYNVTVTGTYAAATAGVALTHSITVPVTVANPGTQLLLNPSFEGGSLTPWTEVSSTGNTQYIYCSFATCGLPPHSGTYFLELDGYGATHTDTITQTVTIPSTYTSLNLSFFVAYETAETSSTKTDDTLTVTIQNTSGTVLATVATLSNLTARTTVGYGYYTYALPASLIGQTVVVSFKGVENTSLYTEFLLDDVSLTAQ